MHLTELFSTLLLTGQHIGLMNECPDPVTLIKQFRVYVQCEVMYLFLDLV